MPAVQGLNRTPKRGVPYLPALPSFFHPSPTVSSFFYPFYHIPLEVTLHNPTKGSGRAVSYVSGVRDGDGSEKAMFVYF